MTLFSRKILCTGFLPIMALFLACGKKQTSDAPEQNPVITPPLETEIIQYLDKQEVLCEEDGTCPTYLAKIVIVNNGNYRFCTGVLTGAKTIATSASCLPINMRSNSQRCDGEIYFLFPKANRKPTRVGCKKMLQVSQFEASEPILWRDDVAFMELDKSQYFRRQLAISREGIADNQDYTMLSIEQTSATSARVRRDQCRGIHNSFVNPLSSDRSSPSMTFAGCEVKNGMFGAPLVDSKHRIRALVSQPMDAKFRSEVISSGRLQTSLKEILYATNFACAPTIFDNDQLDRNECDKKMEFSVIDSLRVSQMSPQILFESFLDSIREQTQKSNAFIEFDLRLKPNGDSFEIDLIPACFKNVSSWIQEESKKNRVNFNFTLLNSSFKKRIDVNGRAMGQMIKGEEDSYYLRFFPKTLKNSKSSDVYLWLNNSEAIRFDDLRACPGLLL